MKNIRIITYNRYCKGNLNNLLNDRIELVLIESTSLGIGLDYYIMNGLEKVIDALKFHNIFPTKYDGDKILIQISNEDIFPIKLKMINGECFFG
jgi:hypothetical protein